MSEAAPATPTSVVERDAQAALLVALVVGAVLTLGVLVNFVESFVFGGGNDGYLQAVFLPQLLADTLPKAIGIFLVLWLWQARSDDRVVMVLVKALVAAAVGCVFAVLTGFVYGVIVFGVRFSDAGVLPYSPFAGIVSSVVMLAPLVMLVVLAQWVIRRGARL
jgi:hypothetical protein